MLYSIDINSSFGAFLPSSQCAYADTTIKTEVICQVSAQMPHFLKQQYRLLINHEKCDEGQKQREHSYGVHFDTWLKTGGV